MAKKEQEFFNVDQLPWHPVDGYPPGCYEKILSADEETGDYTRLLRFAPDVETYETLQHDFYEEVYILKGSLIDKRTGDVYTSGMYACRPPGMKHGPYKAREEFVALEVRFYPRLGNTAANLLRLELRTKKGAREVYFKVHNIINAAFSSRSSEFLMKHVEELQKEGIHIPVQAPFLFPIPQHLLITSPSIQVCGQTTSGEVEYVLLLTGKNVFVSVGSDHTDRRIEKMNLEMSKQVCPKVISRQVWDYYDLKERWDSLILRSWVYKDNHGVLYQEAPLGSLLPPEKLIELVKQSSSYKSLDGMVIFSGTIPLLTGEIIYGDRFVACLEDPLTMDELRLDYRVEDISKYSLSPETK